MTVKTWVILSDIHVPFHDPLYIKIATKVISIIGKELTGVVQLGDALDWWQISKYDKDPKRKSTAYDDAMEYSAILNVFENLMPEGSKFYQIEGNHEDRLRKYHWGKAPELFKMISTVPDMLFFKDRNKEGRVEFKWFPHEAWGSCVIGDVLCTHGHKISKHVAADNLVSHKYRYKVVTGHTHRVQFIADGPLWSVTLGHGALDEKIAHIPAPNAHQQALGVLTLVNGVGSLEILMVTSGKTVFRGEVLDAKKTDRR